MIIDKEVYLEHYGVKGMRWGVRNEEDETAKQNAKLKERTEKAAVLRKEAAGYQKKIDALKQITPKDNITKSQIAFEISDLEYKRNTAEKDAASVEKGGLTQKQKRVLKGAAITIGIIAAYGTYRAVQKGSLRQQVKRGHDFILGKDAPFKTDYDLSGKMSLSEIKSRVIAPINTSYDKGGIGSKMNCRRCTYSYELRRRGYDVAATRTTNGLGQDYGGNLNAIKRGERQQIYRAGMLGFPVSVYSEKFRAKTGLGPKETPLGDFIRRFARTKDVGEMLGENSIPSASAPEAIFKALSRNPNGARGELGVRWLNGGAHSVAWEIINGKPVVMDTQRGIIWKSAKDMWDDKELQDLAIRDASWTRLDNKDLNMSFLTRWAKNA